MHERRQGNRREFCEPRDISEYVAEMRGLISSVRLQLWIKEEIETIEPVGCPDGPDERGEVGKDVSTRTVLLDDRKDRGRYALGAFVTGQAPDAPTILKDLLPAGDSTSALQPVPSVFNSLGLAQGAWPS